LTFEKPKKIYRFRCLIEDIFCFEVFPFLYLLDSLNTPKRKF